MSEYQRAKARALAIQREKEEELKRQLAAKAEREKQAEKEMIERKQKLEAAAKEARRLELMKANDALNKKSESGLKDTGYDPFAEVTIAGPSKVATRPKAPIRQSNSSGPRASNGSGGASSTSRKSQSGNGSSTSTSKPRGERKTSPPGVAMGRKEKAAARLARAVKKPTSGDSVFSIAALVASRDDSRSPGPASPKYAAPGRPGVTSNKLPPKPSASISSKGRTQASSKKSVDVAGLRKLCPDRSTRDMRSLDEIQRDIRARREAGAAGGPGRSGPSSGRGSAGPTTNRGSAPPGQKADRDRDLGRSGRPSSAPASKSGASDRRRQRSVSSDDSDSGYDSPPRKRGRSSRTPPFREPSRAAVSELIQSMFTRPDGAARRRYDDYDSGSDMEAGLSDVEMEEKRALRIARREDDAAEREENARKAAKEKMKRERRG